MDINGTVCNHAAKAGDFLRIEQLQYLVEVADAASINKASERLYISQQSLNTSLTKLEQELNVTLFQRSSQGIELTDEGRVVVEYAEDVLKKTEELKMMLGSEEPVETSKFKGSLDLSVCPPISHWVLPTFLKKFHMDYPKIILSVIECENMEMIYSLLDNSQRLYIMNVYDRFDREFKLLNLENLFYRELCESRTYVVVSDKHPLAKQKSISSSALQHFPLAFFQASEKTPNSTEEHLKSLGKPQVVFKTNNLSAYQQYLDAGDAIGFMGRCTNKKYLNFREDMKLIPIKDFPQTKIVCVSTVSYYSKKKQLIELFMEYMGKYLN